eukprot:3183034-Lingulodinium_polyedra.AAC.1
MPLLRRRAFRGSRTPCVNHHVAVNAWSAHIAKCEAPQQWNAMLNACLSNFRAKAVQKCARNAFLC